MKNISVVIGANYGDEGKGLVTDFLSFTSDDETAVVRYNGGAQAGHTVVEPKTHFRHVFQHLGSGTLTGCPTILARKFVINPLAFWAEVSELSKREKSKVKSMPHVYIDPRCPVTTPYEMEINRRLEDSRGDERHGSCGLGVGETVARQEFGYSFTFQDIVNDDTEDKLQEVKEYFLVRTEELGIDDTDIEHETLVQFCKDARDMARMCSIKEDFAIIQKFDSIVFEGAQGLCLDEESKDFPHVTRSKTGTKYVADILNDARDLFGPAFDMAVDIDIHYVTRIYNTRHGAGPLAHEIPFDDFTAKTNIKDRTNVLNDYQGQLRYATHDFVRLHTDVYEDLVHMQDFNYVTTACVTHCDQVGQVYNDTTVNDIALKIKDAMDTSHLLVSFGRTRAHVLKLDNLELE